MEEEIIEKTTFDCFDKVERNYVPTSFQLRENKLIAPT